MRTVRFYLASGDIGMFQEVAVAASPELGPLDYEWSDTEEGAAVFDLEPWGDCGIDTAAQWFAGVVRRYLLDNGAWSSPFGGEWSRVLFLDIESHGVEKRWSMPPREFFRLGQYAWGEGPVVLTEDYDEVMGAIRRADGVVIHNGHNFDLSVLFGKDSDEPLQMTMARKVIDTMVLANIAYPAPSVYWDRTGRRVVTDLSPSNVRRWLSLDNLAHHLGLEGKVMDLKDLAKQFNPPGTKVADLDFGLIPLDDPTFREYSEQDVVVLRGIFKELLLRHEVDEYDWREQLKAAINAQMSRNGFLIDADKAYDRLYELTDRKEKLLDYLHRSVGMPLDSKQPWRTTKGKQCVLDALAAFGVDEFTHPEWPRTPTGALQLSGSVVQDLLRGHGSHAEAFGKVLGELLGQRSLAQLTIDCLQPDGRVHPEVDDLQRSGRSSTTKPGLTVWTARVCRRPRSMSRP
jgi:DNA polymerase I